MVQVPAHGLAQAAGKGIAGFPAQLALDLRGVDGIAAIVARPVRDEGDELARVTAELRGHFIDEIADLFHDPEVGPFVVTADVVGFTVASPDRKSTRLNSSHVSE